MERSGSTGSGPGSGTGSGPGSGPGNTGNGFGSAGSGRAAPPGGAGRALLCLALLLLLLPPARPLPTPARHPDPHGQRLRRSRDLLEAANASLHRLKELGTLGFECTLEEVDLEDITENQLNTIKACTAEDPGPGNCPALEGPTFDQGQCLQGISADLRAYRAELGKLSDRQVLAALDALLEALGSGTGNAPEAPTGLGSGSASASGSGLGSASASGSGSGSGSGLGSFPQRLRLCSVLQALRIRSVTISRMLHFLSSLAVPGAHPEPKGILERI